MYVSLKTTFAFKLFGAGFAGADSHLRRTNCHTGIFRAEKYPYGSWFFS
jgi:hypothetical protein